MPPKHRPSPDIPLALDFLIRWPWLPVALFWAFTFGAAYLLWLSR